MPENPDYTDSSTGGGGGGGGDFDWTRDPLYSTIGSFFSGATKGRYNPTYSNVSQWGHNVDTNYLNTIRNSIYNSWAPQWMKANPEQPAASAASAAPDTGGGGGGYGGGGDSTYGNADYSALANAARSRASSLGGPVSFPMLDQYMQDLQRQREMARQRAEAFAGQMNTRIGELQKPLLGDKEHALVQAQALNNLTKQRDQALQQMRDRASTSGFAPTSGLIAGNERSINEQFTNADANVQAQLAENEIGQNEQRRNEATQLQGLVAQALSGGDLASLQAAASSADMENQRYNIDQQRAREQLMTLQIPVDLSNMGLQNAMAALGATSGSGLSSLFPLLGYGQSSQNNSMQGMGWLMHMLSGMFH